MKLTLASFFAATLSMPIVMSAGSAAAQLHDPSDAPAPVPPAPTDPAARQAGAGDVAQGDKQPRATIDYSDGTFYLRSADDNLVLTPGGRIHSDVYGFLGPGVEQFQRSNGTGLKVNMFFRRAIVELGAQVRKKFFFYGGWNVAPTTLDANEAPTSSANVYDAFAGYEITPHHRLFAGQYNTPITMENVTSSRWLDFMERALTVRTIAAPYNKDLGLLAWGDVDDELLEYQVGGFGGDGMNRPSVDNNLDGMARVVVRPLIHSADGALKRLHLGGSARFGMRNAKFVGYDAPSISTPGGAPLWTPTYGSGATETHIIPAREQIAVAGELYVPLERFDLRSEFVYVDEGRREALRDSRFETIRSGTLSGIATYAQLSFWPTGTPRINGNPAGLYYKIRTPKDRGTEAPYGLQVVLRGELIRLKYQANDNYGDPGGLSGKTPSIDINALQVATNYWATKHMRFTLEYSLYQVPGVPGASNEAAAPGARSKASNLGADHLHEFSARFGLAL